MYYLRITAICKAGLYKRNAVFPTKVMISNVVYTRQQRNMCNRDLSNFLRLSISERDKLYNPSIWNKRHRPEEIKQLFDKFCTEGTKQARKTLKCQLDVPYGSEERTKYDIYGTDLPKDVPILVYIHGGFWKKYSKDDFGFIAPSFVKNKVKVMVIGYDLIPNVTLGEIVAQTKSAIAQILKYAADSGCKCVCVTGHSAGAHLAASVLHDEAWIDNMIQRGYFELLKEIVLISGVYNLKPLVHLSAQKAFNFTDEEIKRFSFSTLEESKDHYIRDLKVTVVLAEHDTPVCIDENREYIQKVMTIVDNVEHLKIRDTDHFDVVEKFADPNYRLTKLILKCLQPDTNVS